MWVMYWISRHFLPGVTTYECDKRSLPDTCSYFCKTGNVRNGEMNEHNFSNTHPGPEYNIKQAIKLQAGR